MRIMCDNFLGRWEGLSVKYVYTRILATLAGVEKYITRYTYMYTH